MHAAHSELYEYDQINQIKSLDRGILNQSRDAVTATNFTESWNFDKTGNWSSYNKNGVTEARTHNAANELQGIATHDANGNMTLMPGLKGKYDAWNRLVEVRDASDNLIAEYSYNGMNQRISKEIGNVATNSFFNENWQELEATKEAGASTSAETMTYVWGLRYVDDLVYRAKDNERLYSLADPNWNVVAIIDAIGAVQERYVYDAFGKRNVLDSDFATKSDSDFDWDRAFTGQVYDMETGLMLYRNRFYHTELGRFVQRDPIEYDGEDENLYRYVYNAPIYQIDPDGFVRRLPIDPKRGGIKGQGRESKEKKKQKKNWRPHNKKPPKTPPPHSDSKRGRFRSLLWWTPPAIIMDFYDYLTDPDYPEVHECPWLGPGIPNPLFNPLHNPCLPPECQKHGA